MALPRRCAMERWIMQTFRGRGTGVGGSREGQRRRKRHVASAADTTRSPSDQASADGRAWALKAPEVSSRSASVTRVTGWASANARSQPGKVAGDVKIDDAKTRGNVAKTPPLG